MDSLAVRSTDFGKGYFLLAGKRMDHNMKNKGHNCNLCKKTKYLSAIGSNVCTGEKCRGKVIKRDNSICDEYEFGGFIELQGKIYELRKGMME